MGKRLSGLMLLLSLALGSGCATYTGSGVSTELGEIAAQPGWIRVDQVPVVRQKSDWDCGLAALAMVLNRWSVPPNKDIFAATIAEAMKAERPIRAAELRSVARNHQLEAFILEGSAHDLEEQLKKGRPLIVGMIKPTAGGTVAHYEVVVGLHPERQRVLTIDPALGYRENSYAGFASEWAASGHVLLLIVPRSALEG